MRDIQYIAAVYAAGGIDGKEFLAEMAKSDVADLMAQLLMSVQADEIIDRIEKNRKKGARRRK